MLVIVEEAKLVDTTPDGFERKMFDKGQIICRKSETMQHPEYDMYNVITVLKPNIQDWKVELQA